MNSIRLYEPFDFPNILQEINLTSAEIEKQVADLVYKNDDFRYDKAEGKYPIEIVPVFYRFVMREHRIPTQDEFYIEARREMQMNGFDLDAQETNYKHGLIARLKSRTYTSLIRDLHFCKLLTNKYADVFNVLYNPALDLSGVDILMIPKYPNPPFFGICLFLDTQNGWNGLYKKRKYRIEYGNVLYIELPKRIPAIAYKNKNKIWLYDDSDAEDLLNRINRSTPQV